MALDRLTDKTVDGESAESNITLPSTAGNEVIDLLGRPLRDLRISVTDRCNFRCSYCMPRDVFDGDWPFLPRAEMLSYEEMTEVAAAAAELGVHKIRLTGGEPLLRRDISTLVSMLRARLPEVELAMTTNGSLLSDHAEQLASAGLDRITISLDAIEPALFCKLSDSTTDLQDVLDGIEAAVEAGLTPVKLNCVVRRGLNEDQMIPIIERFRGRGIIIRFIEFMDVGNTNAWRFDQVVSADEMLAMLGETYDLQPIVQPPEAGVARIWQDVASGQHIGIIASITQPFCGDCTRARLSADGQLFTCLFSAAGHDLKTALRQGADIGSLISQIWNARSDRFSELRTEETPPAPRVEMSYIGG